MFFKKKHTAPPQKTFSIRSEEEFEKVYHQYAEQMLVIAYNQTGNRETAKEIVQDVFHSLWERRAKIIFKGPIKNYLFRAVKFEVIDFYRQKSRDEKHLTCAFEDFCQSNHSTEDTILFNELTSKVGELVDQLPCQCREVYILSREKGLSNKEIANTLLIAEKTVESHLSKALKFLRKELKV